MTEIRLYKSRSKALKLTFVCGLFCTAGMWGLISGSMEAAPAWFATLFFGLGTGVGLYNLLDKRPKLVINEIGIFDHTIHHEFINWEIVYHAYTIKISGQPFICLVVDEQFRPSKKRSVLYQKAVRLNEALGAQELNISLADIKINTEKFLSFILAMKNAEKPEKERLVKKFLDSGV